MSLITKILKNKTGESYKILGVNIANNSQMTVPYNKWLDLSLLVQDGEELYNLIISEDFVVNNGSEDLVPTDGIILCQKFQPEPLFSDSGWLNYQYVCSSQTYSTSNTNYQQVIRLTTNTLVAGKYRIGWSFSYDGGSNNKDVGVRVQVDDDTTLHEIDSRMNKKNEQRVSGGFKILELSIGSHTIDIDMKKIGTSVNVHYPSLEIWRIE